MRFRSFARWCVWSLVAVVPLAIGSPLARAQATLGQDPVLIPVPGWKFEPEKGIFSFGVLISDIAVSGDGRSLAVRWDSTLTDLLAPTGRPSLIGVSVWNAADGKLLMRAPSPRTNGEIAFETGLAINSDGSRVAICTLNLKKKNAERDRLESRPGLYQVEVWNVARNRIDTTLQCTGILGRGSALRFSPDDATLAINAIDANKTKGQIVQWTVNTRKQVVLDFEPAQKKGAANELYDVQYSLDGKILAGSSLHRIAGWSVESQESLFDIDVPQEVLSFRVANGGKRVTAVAMPPGFDRKKATIEDLLDDRGADVICWNATTGKVISRKRLPTRYLMLSADGTTVFGRPPWKEGENPRFTQWNVETGEAVSDDVSARLAGDRDSALYEAEKRKAYESQENKAAAPGAMSPNGATIVEEDLDFIRVWTTHKPGDEAPAKKDVAKGKAKPGAKGKDANKPAAEKPGELPEFEIVECD